MTITIPIWVFICAGVSVIIYSLLSENLSSDPEVPIWVFSLIEILSIIPTLVVVVPFLILYFVGQMLRSLLRRIGVIKRQPDWREIAEKHRVKQQESRYNETFTNGTAS